MSTLNIDLTIGSYVAAFILTLGFILLLVYKKRVLKNMALLAAEKHWNRLFSGFNSSKVWLKIGLSTIAFCALGIATLRPKWGKQPQEIMQESRNIMFLLDMSRSMLAQDLAPNRLAFMQLKLRNLLERLGPERVGLILFADKAFLHCPFTNDFNAFFAFLEQANHNVVSAGSTSIAQAINCAIKSFKNLPIEQGNRLVFLITDGEDFSSDIEQAIETAKQNKLTVFTIGAGTLQGAPVPILDHNGKCIGHERDKSGTTVISSLNEGFLQNLALRLNGDYLRTTGNSSDIEFIAEKIELFEKQRLTTRQANLLVERHNIFTAIFLGLMLLEWCL